MKENIMD